MAGGSLGRRGWVAAVGAALCVSLALTGCAGSGGSGDGEAERLRSENERLQSENERLQAENEELRAENEQANADQENAEQADAPEAEAAEPAEETVEQAVDESGSEPEADASGGGSGGEIQAVGPDGVGGEEVPDIAPDDFPLPEGAVVEFANGDEYYFSLDFVLDSDLASLTGFYDEQLRAQGWEETDRTEYERDGLEGVETSWEKGTYVPEGSPQDDPDYEQTDLTLTVTLQEIQPSGAAGRIYWNSGKLLDETN